MDSEQALKAHKEKQSEREELNKRRKGDIELVTSYAYTMKGTGKDKKPIVDVINVTMNRLKVFKAYVEAALHKADEKSFVESEDENINKDEIKDFVDAAFDSANYKRNTQGEFTLEPVWDSQSCMLGELAARVLFQEMPASEGKEAYLDTDIVPWDTQLITYESSVDGLAYAGYEVMKTKGKMESETWYADAKIEGIGEKAKVLELWVPDEHTIYIAEKEVFKEPNTFGYVPVCVQKVPIGEKVFSEDNLKYQMESIFFLIRDLIEEYYRCVSVLQTLNFLAIKAATQQYITDGEAFEPGDLRPGANVPVEAPSAISLIPYGKAERAMLLALQEINKAINDGTLARITLGDLPGDLSAVALLQVEQGQGQVYMPRLGARGLLKEQIAPMIIKQCQDLGMSTIEMGVSGHRRNWKIADLDGEYRVGYKYTNKSPETDYARISMAKSYVNVIDEVSILRDVVKRDDPEGDLKRLNRQRLRGDVPMLRIYDGLMALTEAHEDGDESAAAEIAITEAQLGVSAEQLLAGNLPQQGQQAQPQESELPLLAEKSTPQKAADLQKTPTEEEGE